MKIINGNFHKVLFSALVVTISIAGFGQDMIGVISDNNNGVIRQSINPALVFHSPNCIDIHVVGFNAGIQNNFFYIPRGYFRPSELYYLENPYFTDTGNHYLERENRKRIYGFKYGDIYGPNISFKYRNHSFAFTNSVKTISSSKRIPVHLMKFAVEGLSYAPQHNIDFEDTRNFSASSISWAEAGLTYAILVENRRGNTLVAGITAKRLWAYHAAVVTNYDITFNVNSNRDIFVENQNLRAYASLPIDETGSSFSWGNGLIKGRGLALDLGVIYTKRPKPRTFRNPNLNQRQTALDNYTYQLGVSLLDIGAVVMERNTRILELRNLQFDWEYTQFDRIESFNQALYELESGRLSGVIDYRRDQNIWINLPTATSVQFDYNLGKNFYAFGIWVQDLPFLKNRISRPSYIGIVPRYETRWFSFALPFTMYQYTKPRLGASIRLAWLTIGTEQAGGMFNLNEFDGLDVYFSLNFGIENCKGEKRRPAPNPCVIYW